jgi:hypothetical protein
MFSTKISPQARNIQFLETRQASHPTRRRSSPHSDNASPVVKIVTSSILLCSRNEQYSKQHKIHQFFVEVGMGRIATQVFGVSLIITSLGCARLLRSQANPNTLFQETKGSRSSVPTCEQTNTTEEGWYIKGNLIQKDRCAGRFAECAQLNGKGAWVSFIRRNMRLVRFETCEERHSPVCANAGTKSEGWQAADWFQWDTCSNQGIACQSVGSRSEGWYSFEKEDVRPLENKRCDFE